ncbi:MAG: methyltransferase domain-containing protein [Myxococcales bacterium]|nr:methyltransferase domain-containing protein [Myxococcales bacterium]
MSSTDWSAGDPAVEKARARRAGWLAPGPRPRGSAGRADLAPGPEEDLSFLTGDFRIFQLRSGHRWSLDDFVTAYAALQASPEATACVDLGCGIGSVLLMLAWGLTHATLVGIEAQDVSVALARRSIAFNGVEDRCRLVHGDLREEASRLAPGTFDLVTGTPPYIPIGSGLVSNKAQRGPCCFETRGGIEDYARAAAPLLRPNGRFVACYGAQPERRGEDAARAAGLHVLRRIDVVPRAGKPVLLRVLVAAPADSGEGSTRIERFAVRDQNGDITAEMHEARARMGLPP